MNRTDLKRLSQIRVREARQLLDSGHYNGAYYLIGYTVECALKACIAKSFRIPRNQFPEWELKQHIDKIYTHDLEQLLKSANLWDAFKLDINHDTQLRNNWTLLKDWSVESRYEFKTEAEATDLYSAITNRNNGILSWIKRYW